MIKNANYLIVRVNTTSVEYIKAFTNFDDAKKYMIDNYGEFSHFGVKYNGDNYWLVETRTNELKIEQ